jgi:hypothetical protein
MAVRLAAIPAPALALGALWVPTQSLNATPPVALYQFGTHMRMAGDLLVVGAPYANSDNGTVGSGRAYIFRRVNGHWQFETALSAPGVPQQGANFGWAVAVSTQTVPVVVIGEPFRKDSNGDDVGYVWIYQKVYGNWQIVDVKVSTLAGDRFGSAVDVAGDYLVVGAPGWDYPQIGADVGRVETFHRCDTPNINNWCSVLSQSDSWLHASAEFGRALAISGQLVIVGASEDSPNNLAHSGSAFIHNLLAPGPLAFPIKLADPSPGQYEHFGISVAAAGGVFAVGCWYDDEPMGAAGSGAVYIFALSGDTAPLEATLRSPSPQSDAQFGDDIALTSSRIVIGEPLRDVFIFGGGTLTDAGAAHVFRRFFLPGGYAWANVTTIYNFGASEYFGSAVASADGTEFAAGAPWRSLDAKLRAGEVTLYRADLLFADDFE